MRRGLWLGIPWFAAAVAIAPLVVYRPSSERLGSAVLMSGFLFVTLSFFPLWYVRYKVPGGRNVKPPDHGPWSEIEFAVMTFAFLLGTVVVISGIVLKHLGAIAGGLGVFLGLGVGTAALLRKIRLGGKRRANAAGISWAEDEPDRRP